MITKKRTLPILAVILAIAGYMLRSGLFAVAVDSKNLLVRGHPLEWALWICTAAAVIAAVLDCLGVSKRTAFEQCFRRSLISALGHILAASGIALTVLRQVTPLSPTAPVWKIVGLVSAVLLCLAGFQRALGKRVFFGSYALASVFFALHLVGHYQTWCADPQLQNYVFAFLGTLLMMVFCYQQAALCVDMGSSRQQRLTGLLAMYCCFAAMGNMPEPQLYLCSGIFVVTSLCQPE